MFPQTPLISLPLTETPAASRTTLENLLQNNNSISAKVVSATPDPGSGGYKLQLELGGRTLQLAAAQPLPAGSSVQISSQDGRILLQVAPPPPPQSGLTSPPPVVTPPTPVTLTTTVALPPLPANGVQAVVIRSTPVTASAVQQAVTQSATYSRAQMSAASGIQQATPMVQPGAPAGAQSWGSAPVTQAATTSATSTSPGVLPTAPQATTGTAAPAAPAAQPSTPTQAPTQAQAPVPTAAQALHPAPQSTASTPQTGTQSVTPAVANTHAQAAPGNAPTAPRQVAELTSTLPTNTAASTSAAQTSSTNPSVASPTAQSIPAPATTPTPAPTLTTQANTPLTHATSTGTASVTIATNTTGSASGAATVATTPPATTTHSAAAGNPAPGTGTGTASAASTIQAASSPQQSPASSTQFTLELKLQNGPLISARADQPLPANSIVMLKSSGHTLTATPVTPVTPQTDSATRLEQTLNDTLRQVLPQQQPLANSLNQIQSLASQHTATQLPALVRSMLTLFGVRPGATETPHQLRNNVQFGGQYTESTLAKGDIHTLPADLRHQLKQLHQQAQELPKEQRMQMEQLIQSVQARIAHNQVAALKQAADQPDGSSERVLLVDIPVLREQRLDNLELRISQEQSSTDQGEAVTLWRVKMRFDLEESGTIDAEVRLPTEGELQILFWSSLKTTKEKLDAALDSFSAHLIHSGFTTPEVVSYLGEAPAARATNSQKNLVDIRT